MIFITKILWGIGTIALFTLGLYFSFKFKFKQLSIKGMIKALKSDNKISPLNTLMMSLGAKIGVGSLSGVALAIYIGGIGTIFWMWVCAFLVSSLAFSESLLGTIFQQKDKNNLIGGPSYYIRDGLYYKKLASIYAFLIIVAYILGFLTIQSNTITTIIVGNMEVNNILIGMLISTIVGFVIFGGVKNIIKISNILVPIMGTLYIVFCLLIIFQNIQLMPQIISNIFIEAFNFKSLTVGFTTILIGVQRGIFSNEAGIGTSGISSALSSDNPTKLGFIGTIGVLITTLFICTLTALVVETSPYSTLNFIDVNGIEITEYAFTYHLGQTGTVMLIITIILFAFSTIITGYYYGESSLKFLGIENKKSITILKIITLILLIFGSILSSNFLWNIVDLFVILLALINVFALYNLRKIIITESKF
ncbi:MAG: alanine/glycine:cation symporter family protein [Bacilli bacterium]